MRWGTRDFSGEERIGQFKRVAYLYNNNFKNKRSLEGTLAGSGDLQEEENGMFQVENEPFSRKDLGPTELSLEDSG